MQKGDSTSALGRCYLAAVPWLGVFVLGWAILDLVLQPPKATWLGLAALTVLTGSFTVKIPGLVARLSVSEPFVFAATLWFGPSVGAVTAALDALIMSLWLMPGLKTVHRLGFNVSVLVISIWLASQAFFALANVDYRSPQYTSLSQLVGPLYVFCGLCFALNSGMVAAALAIERRQSAFRVWKDQFLWLSLNYFGGASVAALLVIYAKSLDWAVIGLIVPLLAISYLTFRTTLGRLEDANRHLAELDNLHWSTIETLAMAVDAKDQVTHGHIRRVQRFAVGLARCLGVHDDRALRAIEAAALLHDMGKLAIPEYILNKPARLTTGEFETMKLHAALGADLLSEIAFPYPVIPIVRHHHENWDGSGYPDGMRGTKIPLGARILSVVDCYDALTSDRPYRVRMPPKRAIAVLVERRGTMYDPLVVDTFVHNLGRLESHAASDEPVSPTLRQIAALHTMRPAPSPQHMALVAPSDALATPSPSATRVLDTLDYPTSVLGCACFVSSTSSTLLTATSIAGEVDTSLLHATTEVGSRVIGWVASTGLPLINAQIHLQFDAFPCPRASTISAFPAKSHSGVHDVLVTFSDATGLSEMDARGLALVAGTLDQPCHSVSVKGQSLIPHRPLTSNALPKPPASDVALGVVVVRLSGLGHPTSAQWTDVVRCTDKLVDIGYGISILILHATSAGQLSIVVDRIRQYLQSHDSRALLNSSLVQPPSPHFQDNVVRLLSALDVVYHRQSAISLH
jgi:putative nucleotidyltransferase with HDIG domain